MVLTAQHACWATADNTLWFTQLWHLPH